VGKLSFSCNVWLMCPSKFPIHCKGTTMWLFT